MSHSNVVPHLYQDSAAAGTERGQHQEHDMPRHRNLGEDLNLPARAPQIVTSRDRGTGRWLHGLAGLAGVPLPASTTAPDDSAPGPA
jgi:hypothetical protein